jgi:hypothetical protein
LDQGAQLRTDPPALEDRVLVHAEQLRADAGEVLSRHVEGPALLRLGEHLAEVQDLARPLQASGAGGRELYSDRRPFKAELFQYGELLGDRAHGDLLRAESIPII